MKTPSLIVIAAMLLTQPLYAATFNYILKPEDAGVGRLINIEGTPLAKSWIGAPEWSGGSFVTDIKGTEGSQSFTQIYFDLNMAFNTTGLKVGDLAGITYFTKKGDALGTADWGIRIYTPKVGSGGNWFGNRIEGRTPNASDTNWNLWDATSPEWFPTATAQVGGTSSINTNLPGLATDYGDLDILYFSFYIGSSGNKSAISNHIGGVTFTLTNGDIATFALIPEPGSMALLLGGASVFLLLRHRRAARQS